MIIVTGATGQLGRSIVEQLARRIPPHQVGTSTRNPVNAADLGSLGVRVRHGDFDDPNSLAHAFEGATRVLIVSSNARATGGDTLAQHRTAIDVARVVGAKRIVYTSHMGAGASSAFAPMHDHAATEDMLRQCGIPWTALRHGFYAASGIALMGDALKTGVVEAPADGKVSWTAHADLAEAAAILLANDFRDHGARYEGPTPALTGSQSLHLADLCGIASEVLRRPMRREITTDDAMRTKMAARGAPDRATDILLGLYAASRAGEFSSVDPALEQVLGRRPIAMREQIAKSVRDL
jgi:NAD(P)H dehydrogenase (quinone)